MQLPQLIEECWLEAIGGRAVYTVEPSLFTPATSCILVETKIERVEA
jgi:hypothetical protein